MAETLVIKGKIEFKSKNGKSFKIEGDENYFSANKEVVTDLANVAKGEEVELTYVQNGAFRNVSKITKLAQATKVEPAKYRCEKCKAELKDDKYKLCYKCGKAAKDAKADPGKDKSQVYNSDPNKSKTNYGSPEDVAGKEVGCAANCAAAILSGRPEDPVTLAEMFGVLLTDILAKIRAAK